MHRLVISTVGTSLLTNQIRLRVDPKKWTELIDRTANLTQEQISYSFPEVIEIITELEQRAKKKLDEGNTLEIRDTSAELNGIYGLYKEQLSQAYQDIHWLIASDTAQAKVTADLLQLFLKSNGLNTSIYIPKQLSTNCNEDFANGIDELLKWFEELIPGYRDNSYEICFNLVGGFKAIQGFANTIGMFYADKIIYIFEGSKEIITIPRLPITIDTSVIKPVEFALMASDADIWMPLSELQGVRESLLFIVDQEVKLSNWGRLTWNNCKRELLTKDLLQFPRLVYDQSFEKDYKRKNVDAQRKLELHEVLAEISASMLKFNGNTTLFDSRLHFTRYEGQQRCEGGVKKNEIDHFYMNNDGWRVSCIVKQKDISEKEKIKLLHMRHFGEHDYVNDNP
ncbi:putative CRISPR-associated protein [Scytonema tolypothrichoides VB-61278]|nr:putative CRISPR-associated protein [Scytonema tolypothrichoides VB-61278]